MIAEVLTIGTELLLGQTVDSNAPAIASSISSIGIEVRYHVTVGDNLKTIIDALTTALGRSDIVITTGGLGLTADDLTREAIAEVCGLKLPGKKGMPPEEARLLKNMVGTALPFALKIDSKLIIALPGPPSEMRSVLQTEVLPLLGSLPGRKGKVILSRSLKVCGLRESAVEEETRVALPTWSDFTGGNPVISFSAHPGEVVIRITSKADSQEDALSMINPVERAIRERLAWRVFGANEETLEQAVGNVLRERGLRVALAESCTGGLVGHRITAVSGSSAYFQLGAVVYANEAKECLLDVPGKTLKEWGAVSRQTAEAMAVGVKRLSGADIGVAITGIAGPEGATPGKPVGTVYFGLAAPEGIWWRHRVFPGDRDTVKKWAAQEALTFLWDCLHVPDRLSEGGLCSGDAGLCGHSD